MARFLVEILINAAGGSKARAAFDDIGAGASASAKKIQDAGLQSERALRRTAEAAERLQHQMEETKASKGLITDLGQLNARLQAQIAALKGDTAALARYTEEEKQAAQAQRILTAQVKAGVSAQSLHGKEIADQIRLHDRLQAELHQTAQAHNLANRAQVGGTGASGMSVLVSSARSAMGTVAAVTGTLVGLGYTIKRLTDAASESQAVMAQLEAGVESTGGAAGYTVIALDEMASSISRLTGVDDELIAGGEAVLLTFRKIRDGAFFDAMTDAMDLAARKGISLETAINLVGKTYSGSLDGARRAGVIFTESQQKQIKVLFDTGQTLKAQALIHEEFQRSVGGSAVAARDTLGGALLAAQTETGNLTEVLAAQLSPTIRDLTERYVAWAQSAEGQERMAELGHLLANAISDAATAAELLGPPLKVIAMEMKVLLSVAGGVLSFFGWLAERVEVARDQYVGLVRDAGILKGTVVDSTPSITTALTTQLDSVFALRTEYGKLGQAAIAAARDQMAAMEAEAHVALTQAQKNRELLKTREETRRRNAEIGAQKDTGPNAADRELLRQTIELEKHGANLNNIITRQTLRLNEHSEAAAKAAEETENLGGATVDAQTAARKLLSDLLESVSAQEDATTAARKSVSAHKDVKLAQEQAAKVEEIRTAFIKANLTWTEKQTAAVYAAVKALKALKAQEDATLRAREMVLQVTVDTSALDKAIAADEKRKLERDQLRRKTEFDIRKDYERQFAEINQAYEEHLSQIAEGLRDSLTTPKQALENYRLLLLNLSDAAEHGGTALISAAEAQRLYDQALADYTNERFRTQTDALGRFFDTLANQFGGLFSYIADLISSVQQAGDFGSTVGQVAGMFGAQGTVGYGGFGGAGTMGAAAGVGAAAYVWYQVYDMVDKAIKDSKTRNYGTRADYASTGGVDSFSYVSEQGENASKAIRDAVDAVADALGATVVDLPKIGLAIRNDGKKVKAYVDGVMIGKFSSVDEAIDAALREVLTNPKTKLRGLNDLMKQYLGSVTAGVDLDELMGKLGEFREIGDLGLSQAVIQIREAVRHFDSLRESLSHLDPTSEAVIDATRRINEAQTALYQSIKNQLLGIDTSASDALAGLHSFQRGMSDLAKGMEDDLKDKIAKAEETLASRGTGPSARPGGGAQGEGPITGSQAAWDKENARLRDAIAKWKEELAKIPRALTEQELAMGVFDQLYRYVEGSAKYEADRLKYARLKVEIEFALIKGWLNALGMWEQFAEMFGDAYAMAMAAAGKPVGRAGRGGGGTDRKGMREDLRDEIGRVRAEMEGPLHAAFFDFRERLEDFKKRAKEAGLSARDTADGIAALTESFRRSTLERARGYAGIGTDFTRRLKEIQDFFDEVRELGRKKTGIEKWRANFLEGLALDQLGVELQGAIAEFAGLTNPMLAIQMQAQTLQTNLLAFAAAAGWTAQQIADAQAQIAAGVQFQRQQGINSLLDRLFAWMKQAGIQTEEAVEHERTKALLDLQIIQAQLSFYGALTAQVQGWIDDVREWINSPAFGKLDSAADNLAQAARDLSVSSEDMGKAWRDAVQEWRGLVRDEIKNVQGLYVNDNLSNLTQDQQLAAAQTQFRDLLARAGAGDMDALRELNAARQEYLSEARESFGGSAGFDPIWREIMEGSANFLAGAQEAEAGVIERAIEALSQSNDNNTDTITTAIYDSARMTVDAIWETLGALPGYAEGGIAGMRGRELAWVGERGPEMIVPLTRRGMGMGMEAVASYRGRERGGEGDPSTTRRMLSIWSRMERTSARTARGMMNMEMSNSSIAQTNRAMARAERRRGRGR